MSQLHTWQLLSMCRQNSVRISWKFTIRREVMLSGIPNDFGPQIKWWDMFEVFIYNSGIGTTFLKQ